MWSAQCRAFCISSANEGSTGSGESGVRGSPASPIFGQVCYYYFAPILNYVSV
ncbi:hypothetical protein OOU_Y34scaffold00669g16 [Pyricularia oryzae Y34]|nr:hypothetical protein OOU_Y34scaffold00669g16 [Pyricularia oryzae Y34]